MGEEQPDSGTITLGDTVELSYVDQSHEDLLPEKSVWEAVKPDRDLILEMKDVTKTFTLNGAAPWSPKTVVHAVRGVNLGVERGKTTAVVGESGSGKTTCARIALGAELADPGASILFRGDKDTSSVDLQK